MPSKPSSKNLERINSRKKVADKKQKKKIQEDDDDNEDNDDNSVQVAINTNINNDTDNNNDAENEKNQDKKNKGTKNKDTKNKDAKHKDAKHKDIKNKDSKNQDNNKNQDKNQDNKNKDKKTSKNNRILEVKTTQTAAFKQVIERISNFISDCCIVFIPPDESVMETDDDEFYEEVMDPHTKDNKDKNEKGSNIKDNRQLPKSKSDNNSVNEQALDGIKKTKNKGKISIQNEDDNSTKSMKKTSNMKPTKKNTGGIRILRLTEDKSILIKLNLDANNFDTFRCEEQKITIGVDMHNLHALLKMVNDDDPIILYMNRDNRSALYIRSLSENNENSEETDIEIYLLEIGNPDMPIPQTEFQNKITMASDKFHTICKHLHNNSTYVEITSVNNEILFRGQNEGGKVTMHYKDMNYTKKKDKPDQVVQGLYELKNLMGFSKCNKLCNTIEIYLKNDFPLVLVICVATLGKMYVFLSPIENGNN